jgi:alanine-glyoxylate transaminase/serine-glyoxylate transaminase/serine-pyruvate transaminase
VSDFRLMIAGPVDADDETLAAISEQTMPHYGARWMPIFKETTELLKRLFQTQNDVVMMPGPGSSAFEAGLSSLVPAGESACLPSNGFFGERTRQIAEANGIRPWVVDFPLGEPIDPDRLRKRLKEWIPQASAEGQPIRALGIVHHETSTGVLNPLGEIAAVAKELDLPVVVDAVSSLGGTRLPVDEWGIDVCVTVPNKCLGVPPGLALVSVSRRAWDMADANPGQHGWYQDLRTWAWYMENWAAWHPYPITMPTNNIMALHKRLTAVFEIGLEAYQGIFAAAARQVREGMGALDFTLFPDPAYAAPMLSALNTRPDVDLSDMLRYLLEEHRIMVSGGLGELHGKVFRVGHMGRAAEPEYTEAFLEGVRAYLRMKALNLSAD